MNWIVTPKMPQAPDNAPPLMCGWVLAGGAIWFVADKVWDCVVDDKVRCTLEFGGNS